MSRVVATLLTSSSNSSSCDVDFHSVKNYFDNSAKTSSSDKVFSEESDETTGIIVVDTDEDKFNECTDVEITSQLVQIQPLTQETTSITIKGTIFNDVSFNQSNVQASADHFDVKCTITDDKLQATGTWHAITQFRTTLKEEIRQFAKGKKAQKMASKVCNISATKITATKVHQEVSMLNNDVLALMQKCGVFVHDHLKYNLRQGSVTIECPGDNEVATTIAEEFQTEYRQLMMGGKLKEHSFPIPSTYSKQQVDELVSQCNNDYSHSIFTHDHKNNVIKCLSMNARQLSHIKGKVLQQPQATQESTETDSLTKMSLLLTGGRRVTLKQADITKEMVDAIVNAANDRLSHNGGVALAINRASNGIVQQQSTTIIRQRGLLKVGQAAHTGAGGALKCKYVIHTVGPEQYKHKDKSQELLWMACMNTLQLAEKLGVASLAIPPISSGLFRVPKDVVAKTIINVVCQYPCHPAGLLTDVRIVIVDDTTFKTFKPFFIDSRAHINVVDQPQSGAPSHKFPTMQLQHSQSWPETYSKLNQGQCTLCTNNTANTNTRCQHKYCRGCLQTCLYCLVCKVPLQDVTGNQPSGCKMTHHILQDHHHQIPGYEHCSTIKILYHIPNGIQGPTHPHPGRQFTGDTFYAYLPNSAEGKEVLELLEKAFNAKMIFTVGKNNTVTWNGIHHKTHIHGGYENYGYPDHTYLERIKDELQLKLGIITIV